MKEVNRNPCTCGQPPTAGNLCHYQCRGKASEREWGSATRSPCTLTISLTLMISLTLTQESVIN